MTMQQRLPRVQSVLRGPSEASCLQQALADGQRAQANGYLPIAQSWGRDATGITLTVLYELASPVVGSQPAAAPWTQPTTTANAWTPPQSQPGAQPQPVQPASTGWAAPQSPPMQPAATGWTAPQPQPTQPGPTGWVAARPQPVQSGPTAWATPQQPTQSAQPQYQQPMQRPPLSTAQAPAVNRRVAGAIASIVAFVIAFLVYSALNRALY
jgi:hypothetical protein